MGQRAKQIERRLADSRKAREQAHTSYATAEQTLAELEARANRATGRRQADDAALRTKYSALGGEA